MNVALFRNDYALDIAAPYCLTTLANRPNTTVWQYCPSDLSGVQLPPDEPQFMADPTANLISSPREFRQRLTAGEFDLVILTPNTNWQNGRLAAWALHFLETSSRLSRRLQHHRSRFRTIPEQSFAHIPAIVIDMGDFATVPPRETPLLSGEMLYFKREIPYDRQRLFYGTDRQKRQLIERVLANLRQLPLGISNARYEQLVARRQSAKDFDLLWAGNPLNNTIRPEAIQRLHEIGQRRGWKICAPAEKLPFSEFGELMARSKITLSIAGNGWDCFRHYEAVGAGSLPLMNRPTVDATAWHDMPEALFFENHLANFEERIAGLISASEEESARLLALCDARIRARCLWSASMEFVLAETRKRHPTLPA